MEHNDENDAPWCPECGPTCPLHGAAENDLPPALLIAQALQEQIDADPPFAPFGDDEPTSRHAFWGTDPSGYCGCEDCEPTRPIPPGGGQ